MMLPAWTRNILITLGSCLMTAGVIANAFYQRKQFYPSVVYITKSNASMAAIYFQGLILVFLAWKLVRWIFFGQLRPAEVEHLLDKSWFALTETCLAFTVFRDDFSSHFVALFTILLFLKCFHWLAEDRVDFMERTPVITRVFHARAIGLLIFLGFLDAFFVAYAYHSLVNKGVSVQLVFGFEYAILCTVVLFIAIKYILHCIDLANDQTRWDRKAAVLLYSELTINFCKIVLYTTFLVLMVKFQSFPLFAVRPIYMAVKSFKKALLDVILSRRAIYLMNTLYPNATPADIQGGDTTCIICREEMVFGCKKLPCNHIFHTHCLRSWFQRQQTCPTCRLDILRPHAHAANQNAGAAAAGPNVQQLPQGVGQPIPPHLGAGLPFLGFPHPGMPMFPPPPPPFGQFGMPGVAGGVPPRPGMPPFGMPLPSPFQPWTFPLPMPVPPMPVPNFSEMSDEELSRLEGDSRRALEMRVTHLRNIQALLDAAVIQFTQYMSLMTPIHVPPPTPSHEPNTPGSSNVRNGSAPTTPADAGNNGDGNAEVPPPPADGTESDEVRRRRLNRFAQL